MVDDTLEAWPYESKYWNTLKGWWERRNFQPANPMFLPPTGLVILQRGFPLCAGFLFKTDAKTAIIGNLVSDIEIPAELRHLALIMLISELVGEARAWGFKMVSAATDIPKLGQRYEKMGFKLTDTKINHYGRLI